MHAAGSEYGLSRTLSRIPRLLQLYILQVRNAGYAEMRSGPPDEVFATAFIRSARTDISDCEGQKPRWPPSMMEVIASPIAAPTRSPHRNQAELAANSRYEEFEHGSDDFSAIAFIRITVDDDIRVVRREDEPPVLDLAFPQQFHNAHDHTVIEIVFRLIHNQS